MKRLDRPISKEYGPLVLHLKDLEALERLLRSGGGDVDIRADDCQYDSVGEVASAPLESARVRLLIRGSTPDVSIDLHRSYARVYVGTSSLAGTGLFHEIDSILSRRKRAPAIAYTPWFAPVLGIFLGIAIPLSAGLHPALLAVALGVVAMTYAWTIWVVLYRHSVVRLAPSENLWSRNRDQLFVAIVAAVVGGLLGVIGTLLVTRLLGP